MNAEQVQLKALLGEDTKTQFKVKIDRFDSLSSEVAAMCNTDGGMIFVGINDDGLIEGVTPEAVRALNQLVSNVGTNGIKNPIMLRTENVLVDGKIVVVISVPDGDDKPYFDKNGVIWMKNGSDKRKISSREEIKQLFQASDSVQADKIPLAGVGVEVLDLFAVRDFFTKFYGSVPDPGTDSGQQVMENLDLLKGDQLTLGGALMFGLEPEHIKPQFIIKAAYFWGESEVSGDYRDSEDIGGAMQLAFRKCMDFVMRNLHKVQGSKSFNTTGDPEIPRVVIEELIVNALIHRDYFLNEPIKVLMFNDRVEIISPGGLPGGMTVDKMKAGVSSIRNPLLVNFASKGLLPYRGLGTGVRRALTEYPEIEFMNEPGLDRLRVIIWRKQFEVLEVNEERGVYYAPRRALNTKGDLLRDGDEGLSGYAKGNLRRDGNEGLSGYAVERGIEDNNAVCREGINRYGSQEETMYKPSSLIVGGQKISKTQEMVFRVLQRDPFLPAHEIGVMIRKGVATIRRAQKVLKELGVIKRVGSDKTGYWQIEIEL